MQCRAFPPSAALTEKHYTGRLSEIDPRLRGTFASHGACCLSFGNPFISSCPREAGGRGKNKRLKLNIAYVSSSTTSWLGVLRVPLWGGSAQISRVGSWFTELYGWAHTQTKCPAERREQRQNLKGSFAKIFKKYF